MKEEIDNYKKQMKALKSIAAKEQKKHEKQIKILENRACRIQKKHEKAINELEKALEDKTEEMHQNEELCEDKAEAIEVLNREARNNKSEIDELKVKLDHSNKNKQIINHLIDKLECPVCYSIPRVGPPPVCPNGHVVCKDCSRNLETCPVCRVDMGVGKSLLTKTIIEQIEHKCKFDGCDIHRTKI